MMKHLQGHEEPLGGTWESEDDSCNFMWCIQGMCALRDQSS
jgi:hypothetical protein